jgi:hypothetical protein
MQRVCLLGTPGIFQYPSHSFRVLENLCIRQWVIRHKC